MLYFSFLFSFLGSFTAFADNGTGTGVPEFHGDPMVQAAQIWLNQTYTGKYTCVPVNPDGVTGQSTISKSNLGSKINIVKILQHGLFCKGYGAYDAIGTFGDKGYMI